MATVDDYYKELAARPAPNHDKLTNLQTNQSPLEEAPVDGGDGFIGSNTGPTMGFKYVEGKNGSVKSMPVWGRQSTGEDQDMGAPEMSFGGQDSTDEKAPYKHIQTDEGLPQTFRKANGAGDATPGHYSEGEDAMGQSENRGEPDTQSVPSSSSGDHTMSDMPQTEATHNFGYGAPLFKHGK